MLEPSTWKRVVSRTGHTSWWCCILPSVHWGGVGTTPALIGTYVLAGEIARQWKRNEQSLSSFSMEQATKEYERILRPFISSNTRMPPWIARLWLPETRFGIWTSNMIAGLAAASGIGRLMGNLTMQEETQKSAYLTTLYWGQEYKAII